MKKIGLYIHIPFCKRKCAYCDFNSYDSPDYSAEEYVDSLLKEIALYQQKNTFKYETIYIGGGTPTLINCFLIGRIMEAVKPFAEENAEITIECNPGTVTGESLRSYREAGINRLSIGLQAWQDELLHTIGRIHSREEFLRGYKLARAAGFENISVDLMFSLPGQTMEQWEETLTEVCALGVQHISCYSLKLEEGTRLYELHEQGKLELPTEELDRDMYHRAIELLAEHGYRQYEISNFALPGFESRHNLIYWHNGEYLGAGAGSHSRLGSTRFWNHRGLREYSEAVSRGEAPIEGREELRPGEEMWETIFLALRLNEGLDIAAFERKYGISFFEKYGKAVKKLEERALIKVENNIMKLTAAGVDLSNMVFIEFI